MPSRWGTNRHIERTVLLLNSRTVRDCELLRALMLPARGVPSQGFTRVFLSSRRPYPALPYPTVLLYAHNNERTHRQTDDSRERAIRNITLLKPGGAGRSERSVDLAYLGIPTLKLLVCRWRWRGSRGDKAGRGSETGSGIPAFVL